MHTFKIYLVIFTFLFIENAFSAPNIVIVIADDLGYNDVGFHGSDQIPTPNIDALAYNGIIMNDHYVQPICTPSRSAFLTGKYPIRSGMQGYPLGSVEPRALPDGKIFPEYFKDLGYSTKLIGKWHVGHFRANATPTYRGFDSHYGHFTGYIGYYDHIQTETYNGVDYSGYDLVRNMTTEWETDGQYITDLYTQEAVKIIHDHDQHKSPLLLVVAHQAPHCGNDGKLLEAPQERIDQFNYIVDPNRRTYAAMVSKLDDSIGDIISALKTSQMLNNTIILFMSDNGSPSVGFTKNWGSNWPLRGAKFSNWEGGVRVVAAIWSPWFQQTPRVSNDLFHITDWLPTLYSAAGGDISVFGEDFDGIDQWGSLVDNITYSKREHVLININEVNENSAIRYHNWKLIKGSFPEIELNKYQGESGHLNKYEIKYNISAVISSSTMQSLAYFNPPVDNYEKIRTQATIKCLTDNENKNLPRCNPDIKGCLYDMSIDPCEEQDLSFLYPHIVEELEEILLKYEEILVPQINQPGDPLAADPKHFNYTWKPWVT